MILVRSRVRARYGSDSQDGRGDRLGLFDGQEIAFAAFLQFERGIRPVADGKLTDGKLPHDDLLAVKTVTTTQKLSG